MARVTFTADVTSSRASFLRALEEKGARSIGQKLRRAGEASKDRCNELSNQFEPRYADRRRNPGSPELANSFEIRYTGLDQARIQGMTFRIATRSPAFWYLEFGTGAHDIRPAPGRRLAWPGTLLPPDYVVHHPGSTKYVGIWRRAVALQLRERFPGINLGALP